MVKTVNGIIVIDGCNDSNLGNNNQENPSTPDSTSGQSPNPNGTNSNPLNSPRVIQEEKNEKEENIMQSLYGLSPPNFSSDEDDSDDDNNNNNNNNNLQQMDQPDYEMLQEVVDVFNDFLIDSVKDCFHSLVELVTCFQFACVYSDVLSFFYSAEELLSLENEIISKHFTIQENLYHFRDVTFKNKVIMYLRILRELLEEERDDYEKFNNSNQNNNRHHYMELSLGNLEDTLLFIKKIKNLVRNGKHLRYPSLTWHDRLLSLFDDLNSLNDQSHIHFSIQNYQHHDFKLYTQFKRYKLL